MSQVENLLTMTRTTLSGRKLIIDGHPADMFERRVEVGDRIVYPVREGSYMALKHGVVEEVSQEVEFSGMVVPTAMVRLTTGRLVKISSFPRVVIVTDVDPEVAARVKEAG